MAITLNIKKQIPLSSITSIQTHSDLALLVKTTGESYFTSAVENDHTNGVATLAPVIEAYEEDFEDDDDFEDAWIDEEDDYLP